MTLRSEWLFSQQQDKIYLELRLIARPDKYYTLEVIDDPSGTITQQVVQNNPPSSQQVAEQVQTVTTQALKFSAQFNKRYYFATFRFGIIESTGGLGTTSTSSTTTSPSSSTPSTSPTPIVCTRG